MLKQSRLATSILDRLLHHGEVYYLKGESYRLKDKKRFSSKLPKSKMKRREILIKQVILLYDLAGFKPEFT